MSKSVYSLVLSDEVVFLADRAAQKRGISRSSFINEILAKELSCTTPQMRIRDIFSILEDITNTHSLRMQNKPSDTMLSLFGSVSYKYNPTVRYSIELMPNGGQVIGTLKISFRTQSKAFLEALNAFFFLISGLEARLAPKGVHYTAGEGKVIRTLCIPAGQEQTPRETGVAISEFIKMFDTALNTYFSYYPDTQTAAEKSAAIYRRYLKTANYLI